MTRFELGQFGQACRFVDRISDDRVLEPRLGADVPGDRPAGRHSDPEVVLAQHVQQFVM